MVLDLVSGVKSAAELCRQHQLNPQLVARWKTECLESAPLIFEQEHLHNQERIDESERLVGRLTMQQEAIKAVAGQWPTYGYRRITRQLRRQGWLVNHKLVERITSASDQHSLTITEFVSNLMGQYTAYGSLLPAQVGG
jgi:hypothetical protein